MLLTPFALCHPQYYDDAAGILRSIILSAIAPHRLSMPHAPMPAFSTTPDQVRPTLQRRCGAASRGRDKGRGCCRATSAAAAAPSALGILRCCMQSVDGIDQADVLSAFAR